jgi:hypothetical protein
LCNRMPLFFVCLYCVARVGYCENADLTTAICENFCAICQCCTGCQYIIYKKNVSAGYLFAFCNGENSLYIFPTFVAAFVCLCLVSLISCNAVGNNFNIGNLCNALCNLVAFIVAAFLQLLF